MQPRTRTRGRPGARRARAARPGGRPPRRRSRRRLRHRSRRPAARRRLVRSRPGHRTCPARSRRTRHRRVRRHRRARHRSGPTRRAPVETAIPRRACHRTDRPRRPFVALGLVEERAGAVHAPGQARAPWRHRGRLGPPRMSTAGIRTTSPASIGPSVTLADLTVRRPVRTALDVGTGCGIQALLAARHAEHIVADRRERARARVRGPERRSQRGGQHRVPRPGSFFEPVEGELFGLVVCNPPYVISPESAYLFRDSGLGRDRVSERLVGRAARGTSTRAASGPSW